MPRLLRHHNLTPGRNAGRGDAGHASGGFAATGNGRTVAVPARQPAMRPAGDLAPRRRFALIAGAAAPGRSGPAGDSGKISATPPRAGRVPAARSASPPAGAVRDERGPASRGNERCSRRPPACSLSGAGGRPWRGEPGRPVNAGCVRHPAVAPGPAPRGGPSGRGGAMRPKAIRIDIGLRHQRSFPGPNRFANCCPHFAGRAGQPVALHADPSLRSESIASALLEKLAVCKSVPSTIPRSRGCRPNGHLCPRPPVRRRLPLRSDCPPPPPQVSGGVLVPARRTALRTVACGRPSCAASFGCLAGLQGCL